MNFNVKSVPFGKTIIWILNDQILFYLENLQTNSFVQSNQVFESLYYIAFL